MHPILQYTALCLALLFSAPLAAVDLNALVEDYFEKKLELTPITATFIGDPRYNDRVENPASPAYAAAQKSLARSCLAGVRQVDPRGLDAQSRLTLEVLRDECNLSLQSLNYPGLLLPIDQFQSIASVFAVFGSGKSAQPFRNVRDYEDFIKRSKSVVDWINQSIVSMREGMERGITQPRVAMVKVVAQLREVAVEKPEDSIFWGAVQNMPASIQEPDRGRLIQAYREELANGVLPAYRRFADFIEKDYVPKARTSVSWSALPNGAEWYQLMVRLQTTTNLRPAEIHELGLREVARIRSEMEAVKAQVGFQGDLQAFFKHLQADPQFYYSTPQELLAGFAELKTRVHGLLPKAFSIFPKADYEIRAVEPFRAAASAGAFYEPPSEDGSRPGVFYVNTFNLQAQPKYGMETLLLHEAEPGHHFQISIQMQLKRIPRFRRFNAYTAYQEGWALYCESIGRELGLFKDPYQWYGRLSDEMLRAMRLVVDTGLHSKDWTREQAIAYMRDNSSMAESDVEAEVDRYIVTPGQALGYKVGQLRITGMREKAEQQLGKRFDVKAFHSVILRDGPLPMDVLERKVDRWLSGVARKTSYSMSSRTGRDSSK
jgi:uncharacterized protein (DUF885 family)